jgi:hypothetical protein
MVVLHYGCWLVMATFIPARNNYSAMRKRFTAVALLFACTLGIGYAFWQHDLQYQKPAPVPSGHRPVALGSQIDLTGLPTGTRRPVLLHFFNPACPCSRFNLKHFLSLVRRYEKQVTFCAVVPPNADLAEAAALLDGRVQIVADTDRRWSRRCGVYASPQAVLIDADRSLYYRGNYNRNRYCTRKETSFAETALVALTNHQPAPVFDAAATTAYGCQLPQKSLEPKKAF